MNGIKKLALAWLGLLALLALTVGSSFIELGPSNSGINLAVAAAKTAVIVLAFMHFTSYGPLPRLAAGAAVVWLVILFVLTLTDQA